ncbi:MAG: hypothetical protein NDJ89_07265 [Oligoflexia bacterium]|nr:hypothetical protein [Oligoflexia bacterium]
MSFASGSLRPLWVSILLIATASTPSAFAGEELLPELKVNFLALKNYRPADVSKVHAAAELIERTVNSSEFREAVLSFTFKGARRFNDNNGLTNEEIYRKLREGNELLLGRTDYTADFDLQLYVPRFWQSRNVIGYTNPDEMRIYVNRRFFEKFTIAEIAANMIHEWTHKLGFGHTYERTPDRPYSVPYGVGRLIQELGPDLLDGGPAISEAH